MAYLYSIKMCLCDKIYFKSNCYISGKVFKSKQRWILLSLKSQTLSLLSNQSDIKRLYNIIMMIHIITVGKLHIRIKVLIALLVQGF